MEPISTQTGQERSSENSLVQAVFQSWELRPGCSGLCHVGAWKPPRMEPAQPCWEPMSLPSPVPPGESVMTGSPVFAVRKKGAITL